MTRALLAALLLLVVCDPARAQLVDPEKGTRDGSPLDDLPPHIMLVSDVGMRPDWSPDGKALLYLDRAPLGDVWRIDVETGATRKLTGHFPHRGFSRAQYLRTATSCCAARPPGRCPPRRGRRPAASPACSRSCAPRVPATAAAARHAVLGRNRRVAIVHAHRVEPVRHRLHGGRPRRSRRQRHLRALDGQIRFVGGRAAS